ncbi:hypothetical protein [Actinoplanes sp. OR16]|uniref:hypothetical protein n=1 Tax=Actinoplanes sp. OR16 TaxID=946334 RepID=UPI00135F1BA2|nr:hypothetical protein [Actinoplanes sp. OR16]
MATCNLCPPGRREHPEDEMAEHLRTAHPEVDEDGTRKGDDSSIVTGTSLESAPEPTA